MKNRTILYLLLLFTIVSRLALTFRPETQIAERPYQEDAFYAFDCAKHLAQGHGLSVDGIHPTNGVQPLIVFVYSICFYISGSDIWLGVRLSFIIVAILESLCVLLIYKLINNLKKPNIHYESDPALTGAFLWTFILSNLIHNAIGLETGLYATTILYTLYLYSKIVLDEGRGETISTLRWIGLGAMLGIVVLSRIDGVFLVGSLSLCVFVTRDRKGDIFLKRISPSLIITTLAIIVSLPWWIYNYSVFGSIMPISGQSESLASFLSLNVHFAFMQLANICFTLFYVPTDFPPGDMTLMLSFAVITSVIVILFRTGILQFLRSGYQLKSLMVLLLCGVFIFLYYTFFFAAPHFMGRYFHPIRIVALITTALVFPEVLRRWKNWGWENPLKLIVVLFVTAGIVFNLSHYIYNFTRTKTSLLYWDGVWASRHPQYKIGLTSSGTAGFMSDNIVNLDGKVNVDALRARKDHRIGKYVIESGINVLTGLDQFIIDEVKQQGIVVTPIDSFKGEGFFLLKR